MISSVNQNAEAVQQEELDKLRLAKAVTKHRPLVQDLINDAIDTAVSAGRKIGAYIFEVMRLIGIPSETSGTFNACEAEWRTKHPDADGKPATKLPVEARSYLNTKSTMLKQWDTAPYYANAVREYAGIVAMRTGQPVADLLPQDGFLEIDSDRYAGPVVRAVAKWRDDFRVGVEAEKQVKAAKAGLVGREHSTSGSGSTVQGLGNSGTGGTFPTVVRDAMNDLVKAVNEAENILSVVMIAELLKDAAKAIRAKTEIYRPKLDKPGTAAELAEALPESDESVHGKDEPELTDEEGERLDKDLGASTAQG